MIIWQMDHRINILKHHINNRIAVALVSSQIKLGILSHLGLHSFDKISLNRMSKPPYSLKSHIMINLIPSKPTVSIKKC